MTEQADTLFQLHLRGGATERLYRRARPEVEALPWGSLRQLELPAPVRAAARRHYTEVAFQEHRTAAACAEALRVLVAAQAPYDLIALAARFPVDELVHVELCARVAEELGGAAPLLHDPRRLVPRAKEGLDPLLAAADLVVRYFCVGEAVSVPLLRASWKAATHPLIREVLRLIVKDEAAHGELGWMFLDWYEDELDEAARDQLAVAARQTIANFVRDVGRSKDALDHDEATGHLLGWLGPQAYLEAAREALETAVLAPLRERGIDPGPVELPE